MTTIRVARRDRYVVIDQSTVRDRKLSLRARGLLVTLLSYPDNWRINSTELANHVKEGRDAIRFCLAELEDAGYLTRNKCQTARGRWVTELVLRETPGATDDGFSGVGDPAVENTPIEQLATAAAEQARCDKAPAGTDDGLPGVGAPGVGKPGANRKTVRTTDAQKVSRDGCARCDGTGYVIVEFPIDANAEQPRRRQYRTEAHRCECNPVPRGRITARF